MKCSAKKKYRANFLISLNFLISKCDLRTWLHNFFMYIIEEIQPQTSRANNVAFFFI
jgi:hypothetical protein